VAIFINQVGETLEFAAVISGSVGLIPFDP